MKLKQLLVTYVDKVILVVMAIVFLWAAYTAFFKGSPEEDALREDIPRSMETLGQHIKTAEPPPLAKLDDAEILSRRYAHLPVVEPYRRYVLYRPAPIVWGEFNLLVAKERELTIKGVQITQHIYFDKETLKVSTPEPLDLDDPSAGSHFKVLPLVDTARRKTNILSRDIEGVMYVARVTVYKKPPEDSPFPPKEAEVSVHRGKVLIKVRWDNPVPMPRKKTETAGFWVYRKLAGRPDDTFQLLNEDDPATPSAKHQARMEEELKIGRFAPDPKARAAATAREGEGDGPQDAPEVDVDPGRRTNRLDQLRTREQILQDKDLAYFVDRTADPGETYMYRIVAVTADVHGKRIASEPWTSQPVLVPSDVQFWLSNIFRGVARVRIRKQDHDLDLWHDATFSVVPGMMVGGKRSMRYRDPYTDKFERKSVDFSTGAVLVAAFARAPGLRPRFVWQRQETPDGGLKVRSKSILEPLTEDVAIVLSRKRQLVKLYRSRPTVKRKRAQRRRTTKGPEDGADEAPPE